LLPLVDAQIVGLYVIARRYRFALRRRSGTGYSASIFAFSVFNAASLILLIAVCLISADDFGRNLGFFLYPIGEGFRSLGYTQQDFEAPHFQYLVTPLIIGATISGPPLALGLILARLANRYELLVVRRSQPETAPVEERAS
jgi:hypothetical protein